MLSMPPATNRSPSPARMACAASIIAFIPEPQTLFIVVQGIDAGTPAPSAACRAGAWPRPAETTLPKKTSSMCSAGAPARDSASPMACEPSSVALLLASVPMNFPIGVLTAETMNAWFCGNCQPPWIVSLYRASPC